MRKVGAKRLPQWVVIAMIAVVVVGLLVYFELTYGFMFGENGIFNFASVNQPTILEFDEAAFEDASYRYDATDKKIKVTGIPNGATVEYDIGNVFREVGVYNITATISMEGYKSKTMTATLEIYLTHTVTFKYSCGIYGGQIERYIKIGASFDDSQLPEIPDFYGYIGEWESFDHNITENIIVNAIFTEVLEFDDLKFANVEYGYDGTAKSLVVTGVPEGATVTYDIGNSFTEIGFYTITATVSKEGYKTKKLTATLEIYKTYKITFVYDFNGVSGQFERFVKVGESFNMIDLPDVPEIEGYIGEWESFDIEPKGDIVVNAIYTSIEG